MYNPIPIMITDAIDTKIMSNVSILI